MSCKEIIKKALSEYSENELIFASVLYRDKLYNLLNETAYYKTLERMCKNHELAKCSKGIYYKPLIGKYGIVPISEDKIINTFLKKDTGMVIGYSMYNYLNLTTQVSKTVNVLSSSLDTKSKTIKNVLVKHVDIDYTIDVKNMISALEILQNFNTIEDLNYSAFIEYSKSIADNYKDEVFKNVINKLSYKKSTISFLKDILDFYNVKNNLNQYLSTLSSYNHPKMEEIYELA